MGSLAAQPEPADDGAVAVVVVAHQVRKQASTLSDELEKSASRVVVLGKATQMLSQSTDTLGQQSDLDFRRSRVTFVHGVIDNDAFLGFPRQRHPALQTKSYWSCLFWFGRSLTDENDLPVTPVARSGSAALAVHRAPSA